MDHVFRFKIYYDDGRIISSEDMPIEELPRYGVVLILQERRNPVAKPQLVQGNDFFYLNTDEEMSPNWRVIDWTGVLDRLLHQLPISHLLQGRQVSNEKFLATIATAQQDEIYTSFFRKDDV
jgi:hypothetical protein